MLLHACCTWLGALFLAVRHPQLGNDFTYQKWHYISSRGISNLPPPQGPPRYGNFIAHAKPHALHPMLCIVKYGVNQRWHCKSRYAIDVDVTLPSITVKFIMIAGNRKKRCCFRNSVAQRPASSSSRGELIAPTSHEQNFKATCPLAIELRGLCGPGSVKLGPAWPAAASTTSHRPGSGAPQLQRGLQQCT